MKIFSWNVNGLRAVLSKGTFQAFIAGEQPDIICLQEIKAKREQVVFTLPGYEQYWHSADKNGYSGTAIFSKQKVLTIHTGFDVELMKSYNFTDKYGDMSREGRVITAELEDFYLVTVYTPNSKGDLSRLAIRAQVWDPAFLAYCLALEVKKPVVFCGDLNVAYTEDDLANPASNVGKHGFTSEERSGFKALIDAGFVDSFREFTQGNGHYSWWTHWANSRARNVGWRIDYILISAKLRPMLLSASIHPGVMGSDHCPVSIELNV